ncbi:hypothetical protein [Streptosporangium saharense]|uniref:Uncharacterized protein n=1 Tax=Streptosporangium saharense TaxID=1706840 RepID=A0A7W7VLC7_9ACTN|nr:hypothetical protein [Streptosporangium saharense]MBB4914025.1 hypothetical protein [Streptosporangium saharense]
MMPLSCDAVRQAHPGRLVFHNPATGVWSAYRSRPYPGDVSPVRAGFMDATLGALASLLVPPSIRDVAATRALRTRPPGLRRLPRS